jgi:hypothetical protein
LGEQFVVVVHEHKRFVMDSALMAFEFLQQYIRTRFAGASDVQYDLEGSRITIADQLGLAVFLRLISDGQRVESVGRACGFPALHLCSKLERTPPRRPALPVEAAYLRHAEDGVDCALCSVHVSNTRPSAVRKHLKGRIHKRNVEALNGEPLSETHSLLRNFLEEVCAIGHYSRVMPVYRTTSTKQALHARFIEGCGFVEPLSYSQFCALTSSSGRFPVDAVHLCLPGLYSPRQS